MTVTEKTREERGSLILHRIMHRERIKGLGDSVTRILIVQEGMKFHSACSHTEVPDAFSPDIKF